MKRYSLLWLSRTALFISLLIVIQLTLASLGQYVVGSLVNTILIIAYLANGVSSGIFVALLSPLIAFLFGIGPPYIELIPFICIGNSLLVFIWYIFTIKFKHQYIIILTLIIAAIVKFLFLYISIVKILIPALNLLPKPAQNLSLAFSFPQLITALCGGIIATIIYKYLKHYLFFTNNKK